MVIARRGHRKRPLNLYLPEELIDRAEAHRVGKTEYECMSALVGSVLSDYLDGRECEP